MPAHVDQAVAQALAKLPADRFATANLFAEALVRPTTDAGVATPSLGVPSTRQPRAGDRLLSSPVAIGATAVALLFAGASIGSVLRSGQETPTPVTWLAVTLPSDMQFSWNLGTDVAITPDGSQLVFVAQTEQGPALFLRSLDDLDARPLPGTEGASMPFFSPDGRWIAFKTADGLIKKMALEGGPAITIAPGDQNWIGADWGPNDEIVVGTATAGLFAVSAAGDAPRSVTQLDTAALESGHLSPHLLPGGNVAVFHKWVAGGFALAAYSFEQDRVTSLGVQGSNPHYLRSGHLLYTSADGSGLIVPFDLDRLVVTGPPTPVLANVSVADEGSADLAISQSGTLAYLRGLSATRLSIVRAGGAVEPLPLEPRSYGHPRFSPDGNQLVFEIGDPAMGGIWVLALDGSAPRRVAQAGGSTTIYPVWLSDGGRIAFTSTREGLFKLYVVSVEGGEPQPLFTTPDPLVEIVFAPDGQRVVYRQGSPGDLWYRGAGRGHNGKDGRGDVGRGTDARDIARRTVVGVCVQRVGPGRSVRATLPAPGKRQGAGVGPRRNAAGLGGGRTSAGLSPRQRLRSGRTPHDRRGGRDIKARGLEWRIRLGYPAARGIRSSPRRGAFRGRRPGRRAAGAHRGAQLVRGVEGEGGELKHSGRESARRLWI